RLFPTPAELCSLQPQDIVTGWKSCMKRHSGHKKARSLLVLAKRSIGTKQALDAYKLHLGQLLEEYDLASSQLERVTQEVTNVLEQIPFVKQILAI
ncbi:IS110 family transposase, partial [Peribacillus simplex]|nr:IS110 family transposase [Peribacillus simplex]